MQTCSCIPLMLDVLLFLFFFMPRSPAVQQVEKKALEYPEKQVSLGWMT